MPTYITPDLVPPVLALPTGSRRGTWALGARPPRGHAHPPLPAPRAHPSANVATHTHHIRLASASRAMGSPRITIAQLRLSTYANDSLGQ